MKRQQTVTVVTEWRFHRCVRWAAVAASLLILSASQTVWLVSAPMQRDQSKAPDFAILSTNAAAARVGGHLEEAARLYQKALALRPAWTEGWWSLGTTEYDLNRYADAKRAFEKVVTLAPKDGTAWAMLGFCEFELGEDANSLRHIEEGRSLGIARDPQLRHVVLYHEGVLLRRKGQFEEAKEAFGAVCAAGVQNDQVADALGLTALRLRRMDHSEPGWAEQEVLLHVGQAECLAARGKIEEAQQIYRGAVGHHPAYLNIHYAYGKFLLELHDTKDATKEFEKEIRNDPGQVMARLEIAAIKYRVNSEAGLPYAEEAVRLDPQLPFGHYLLGLLLVDTKRYHEAIRELDVAQPSFREVANLYYALGTAYSRTGRRQDAKRAWATFARLNREAEKSGPLYYGQKPSGIAEENPGR